MKNTIGLLVLSPLLALAAGGDSGTATVAEMSLNGTHLLMMIGGLAVLGLVLWGVVRLVSK